jgi:hypothetical protein
MAAFKYRRTIARVNDPAIRVLSKYCFEQYWSPCLVDATNYEVSLSEGESPTVTVTRRGKPFASGRSWQTPGRCPCVKRFTNGIQCVHEIAASGMMFDKTKFHPRHYQTHEQRISLLLPEVAQLGSVNGETTIAAPATGSADTTDAPAMASADTTDAPAMASADTTDNPEIGSVEISTLETMTRPPNDSYAAVDPVQQDDPMQQDGGFEMFLAYRFALQYYRSRVSSRSELLSTPVTKFGDPRGAASTFPPCPLRIPHPTPVRDGHLDQPIHT